MRIEKEKIKFCIISLSCVDVNKVPGQDRCFQKGWQGRRFKKHRAEAYCRCDKMPAVMETDVFDGDVNNKERRKHCIYEEWIRRRMVNNGVKWAGLSVSESYRRSVVALTLERCVWWKLFQKLFKEIYRSMVRRWRCFMLTTQISLRACGGQEQMQEVLCTCLSSDECVRPLKATYLLQLW